MAGHHKWADIKRKSKSNSVTVRVGTIWYHPLSGPGRPFIVERIENGISHSKNLDDDGEVEYPLEELTTFLTKNPEYLLDGG